jgi:hypothetical protein
MDQDRKKRGSEETVFSCPDINLTIWPNEWKIAVAVVAPFVQLSLQVDNWTRKKVTQGEKCHMCQEGRLAGLVPHFKMRYVATRTEMMTKQTWSKKNVASEKQATLLD